MHGHMKDFLNGLDFKMENQGKTLVITIKGDEEKLKVVEKKLKAMHDLCGDDCNCGCSCC